MWFGVCVCVRPVSTGPSKLARTHKAVIAKLIDLICASKHDLYWYFTHLDSRHTGSVSRVEWADALKTVLKLDLPFMRLVGDLADVGENGRINYGHFLDRYKVDVGLSTDWHDKMVEKVYEKLVVACADPREAYKLFDVNDDGTVEYHEFVTALKKLDLGLSDAQLFDFMGYLDEDRNSHLDFDEFVARFQIIHQRRFAKVSGACAPPALLCAWRCPPVVSRLLPPQRRNASGRAPCSQSWARLSLPPATRRSTFFRASTCPTPARCRWKSSPMGWCGSWKAPPASCAHLSHARTRCVWPATLTTTRAGRWTTASSSRRSRSQTRRRRALRLCATCTAPRLVRAVRVPAQVLVAPSNVFPLPSCAGKSGTMCIWKTYVGVASLCLSGVALVLTPHTLASAAHHDAVRVPSGACCIIPVV